MIGYSLGLRRFLSWTAFALALLLFCASLLTLFTAPTSWLWIVSILVTEWPHWAALISLVVAVLNFPAGTIGKLGAALATLALLLFLLPIVQAARIARTLPELCTSAFGETRDVEQVPFSIGRMFRGMPQSDVQVTEHTYATLGKKSLKLDLYQPRDSAEPHPLIVMVHGGSWSGGNKQQLPAINRHLAQRQFAVAAINYRKAPDFPSPAAVEDVFRAIDFLRA
ncbi:MAG: alpha/beta hydrolase, partial [Chthoniobacterales bacterium]|nr:alpha/beta hydrolase [Chthoniobacterales bacterium]